MLIPSLRGEYPPYFIYGPMVFSKATLQFNAFLGSPRGDARLGFIHSPLVTRIGDPPDAEREELVMVSSPLFPHKLSKGYSNPSGCVVYSVNGTKIRSLAHLVAVLRDLKDEFVTFEFDGEGGEGIVFPRAEAVAATDDILNDNDIRAQGSPDMLESLAGKAAIKRLAKLKETSGYFSSRGWRAAHEVDSASQRRWSVVDVAHEFCQPCELARCSTPILAR